MWVNDMGVCSCMCLGGCTCVVLREYIVSLSKMEQTSYLFDQTSQVEIKVPPVTTRIQEYK